MKKTLKLFTLGALCAVSLTSCFKENGDDTFYPNAIVTVKQTADGVCYLQLDDETTLRPSNIQKPPYSKEVRALTNISDITEYKVCDDGLKFDKSGYVNWVDSVRTKESVRSLGKEEDDKKYGVNNIEVIGNWVTVLEDGYLTLSFATMWGDTRKPHSIDLVTGVDADDPYLLELRHNNLEDIFRPTPEFGIVSTGIIAFKLKDLPSTDGKTVKLKIRYTNLDGNEKTVSFDYCTGEKSETGKASLTGLTKGIRIR